MSTPTINSIPAIVAEVDLVPGDSVLTIDTPMFKKNQNREIVVFITVVTGSFQFAVGAAPGVTNPTFDNTSGTITLTLGEHSNDGGGGKLHFTASAQNDDFILVF